MSHKDNGDQGHCPIFSQKYLHVRYFNCDFVTPEAFSLLWLWVDIALGTGHWHYPLSGRVRSGPCHFQGFRESNPVEQLQMWEFQACCMTSSETVVLGFPHLERHSLSQGMTAWTTHPKNPLPRNSWGMSLQIGNLGRQSQGYRGLIVPCPPLALEGGTYKLLSLSLAEPNTPSKCTLQPMVGVG